MNRKNRQITFSFLLIGTIFANSLSVMAKDNLKTLHKEKTFTTKATSEKGYENPFQEELKENEITYKLKDVKYTVSDTKLLTKVTKEIKSEIFETAQDEYAPAEQEITEAGITYTLKESTPEEGVFKEGKSQTVEGYTDYDYVVTKADVAQTKTVSAINQVTGEQQNFDCKLTGISENGTKTVTVPMTITFYGYDSMYFEIGGNLVQRDDNTPPLKGYESELLSMAGASSSDTITNIYWSGSSYQSGDETCRNAIADVQRKISVYRANYSTTVEIPEVKGITYKSTYEGLDPKGEKEFTVKAVATYQEISKEKNMLPIYIGVGIGLLILIGLIVLVLYILAKKKKETGEEENGCIR